jgi:hypothetical protein
VLGAGQLAYVAATARRYANAWTTPAGGQSADGAPNSLQTFFDGRDEGRGIFKWRHYFEVYDRHLRKFVGREAQLLEIGVLAGGSLDMWRHYLGERCHLYGVDINPASRSHEDATIFIGDQGDRGFWRDLRARVPQLDIVIDDGSHVPAHQTATLEELLPHLRPGGVYICEDIHGQHSGFLAYLYGLQQELCSYEVHLDPARADRHLWSPAAPFQTEVHSIHLYPFLAVIERRDAPIGEFVADRRGTRWVPETESS